MKKFLISFLLITILICNSSLHVYASDNGGGGYSRPSSITDTTGFDDWSKYDKFCWWKDNVISLIGGGVGCIFNPLNWNYEHYMSYLQGAAADKQIADFSENYQDYIANKLGLNDSGKVVVDDELMDIMYIATTQYIEEETGWTVFQSYDYKYFLDFFSSQTLYHTFENLVKTKADNQLCSFTVGMSNGFKVFEIAIFDYDGLVYGGASSYLHSLGLCNASSPSSWVGYDYSNFVEYSDKYATENVTFYRFYEDGSFASGTPSLSFNIVYLHNGSKHVYTTSTTSMGGVRHLIDNGCKSYRIYKTMDDYKSYSVGERPYYITDKFQDYDINGDNSCIVTESDLSNGSVYGDVYNYIINNYDNPDGLTEDELRDILNDYFGQSSGGSGSGSGSGDSSGSGSSGGGLSGFLSGLGSLGDAILGILGKLIEYIGKAIDLITNGLTGIIDKIPKGVTDFMSAIFPFMPEEFFTALTLAMVLGVVCIVIKIFK